MKLEKNWTAQALRVSISIESLKALAYQYRKALVIVIGSLGFFAVAVAVAPSTADDFKTNTLDHSWIIGLAATLQQGEISGRDFYFTYGPLSQALAQVGVWLNGSASALDAFFSIVLSFRIASIVFFALLLGLVKPMTWKHTLFMFLAFGLLNVLLHYPAFRMIVILLAAAVLYRTLAASNARRQRLWAVMGGGLCLVAQLFSVELGLQTILAAIVVLAAYTVCARFPVILKRDDLHSAQRYLSLLAIIVGSYLLGNLLVSILFKLSSPTYANLFDYQRYNLEIIRGYNYAMGIAWLPYTSFLWGLLFILLYMLVFILGNLRRFTARDGYLLFSFLIACVLALKGMLLRSDWGHITLAIIPLMFLLFLLGGDWLHTGKIRLTWVGSLLVLFVIWPGASFTGLQQLRKLSEGEVSFIGKLQQITSYRAAPDDYLPAGLQDAFADPSRPLLIFPYQNYIGIALERKLVAPVLQVHIANTEAMQQIYVEHLERQNGTFDVLYGVDALASVMVDSVQHVTRAPIIFEYLYSNFELQSTQAYGEGYYLLRPRSRPVDLSGMPLRFAIKRSGSAQIALRLEQPAACGLVRLRMTMTYPISSVIGRPNALHVQFFSAHQEIHQSDLVAIETGREFMTYVSLMDADRFFQVFGSTDVQTKQWDALQISPRETGPFGISPNLVEVSQIECINL